MVILLDTLVDRSRNPSIDGKSGGETLVAPRMVTVRATMSPAATFCLLTDARIETSAAKTELHRNSVEMSRSRAKILGTNPFDIIYQSLSGFG